MFWGLNEISHESPLAWIWGRTWVLSLPLIGIFHLPLLKGDSVIWKVTPVCSGYCTAAGPCPDAACSLSLQGAWPPSPCDHSSVKEAPIQDTAESPHRGKINFLSISWPSLLSFRLTVMNHFLCLILLFTVLCRVGGLEPQPLIYKVVGKTKIKQREVALLALRPALWSQRYSGCTWRF